MCRNQQPGVRLTPGALPFLLQRERSPSTGTKGNGECSTPQPAHPPSTSCSGSCAQDAQLDAGKGLGATRARREQELRLRVLGQVAEVVPKRGQVLASPVLGQCSPGSQCRAGLEPQESGAAHV